ALSWRDTVLGRVLGRLDHDAADRTRDRAQLAAHTLLQAVGVTVKDMLAPLPRRYRLLALRVFDGDDWPGVVLESRQQRADHVDVLGHEEEREAHAGILRVVAGHQFRLGLREVEGSPVRLRDSGDQVEEEGREEWDDEPPGVLGIDDIDEPEGASKDENRYQ